MNIQGILKRLGKASQAEIELEDLRYQINKITKEINKNLEKINTHISFNQSFGVKLGQNGLNSDFIIELTDDLSYFYNKFFTKTKIGKNGREIFDILMKEYKIRGVKATEGETERLSIARAENNALPIETLLKNGNYENLAKLKPMLENCLSKVKELVKTQKQEILMIKQEDERRKKEEIAQEKIKEKEKTEEILGSIKL